MTSDIRLIQDLLMVRGRSDLAYLLHEAQGDITSLHQYGTHWNSFLAEYIISVFPSQYEKLTKLSASDLLCIREAVIAVHPTQENAHQIEKLVFRLLPDKETHTEVLQTRQFITSWLQRSEIKYHEAERHLTEEHFAESISSSQEALELTLKAIVLACTKEHLKRHEITLTDMQLLLRKLPPSFSSEAVVTLFLHTRFWLHFYTVAKYGLEELRVGPEKLFSLHEATLALLHVKQGHELIHELKGFLS